jgi:hypothetical protein
MRQIKTAVMKFWTWTIGYATTNRRMLQAADVVRKVPFLLHSTERIAVAMICSQPALRLKKLRTCG